MIVFYIFVLLFKKTLQGFPGRPEAENLPPNAGDPGLIPGPGGSHMLQSNKPTGHSHSACALELKNGNNSPDASSPIAWSQRSATRADTAVKSPCTTAKQ